MGISQTALSRVECGRSLPSIGFVERFAEAIGRPVAIMFGGKEIPDLTKRTYLAGRAFGHLLYRRRLYPESARGIGVDGPPHDDPGALLLESVNRARRPTERDRFANRWEQDCRRAVAIAAIYYEAIDWAGARGRLSDGDGRRLEAKARRRARRILTEPSALDRPRSPG
jgi:transcriptional regulator with XRE-family HTH domain